MEMSNLNSVSEAVNSQQVPTRTLYTGAKIPAIGLGTFGSDKYPAQVIADAVIGAAEVGYRHFDCAAVYGNEHLIGHALQKIMQRGIRRADLWVTSKLWNDKHAEPDVIPAFQKSLHDLQLEYLDLYLVHWPFPNYHAPGVSVDSRDPHAKPYIHENFMRTWRQLEKLYKMGLVRHIGTSNVTIPKLKLILRDAEIKPAVNEMELHPHFQQPELYQFVVENGIVPIGYSPIGSPSRPERDRTPDDTVDMDDPVIVEIAKRHNLHPAVVCLKWGVQRGHVVIPFATKRAQYVANLQGIVREPLSDDEMRALATIDKNCRLIKGQVFLWQGARGWQDLWDLDGRIAQ
jgi:diketogulonate reductase-like aldo/keto reductase